MRLDVSVLEKYLITYYGSTPFDDLLLIQFFVIKIYRTHQKIRLYFTVLSLFSAFIYNWNEISFTTENNATDLITTKTGKDCIREWGAVQVDDSNCPKLTEIVLWYKKIHTKQIFDEARQYCQDRDWRLFGEYNGTQKQIDWLLQDMGAFSLFLGIERIANQTEWLSDKGEVMTSLINSMLPYDNIKITRRIILHADNSIFSYKGKTHKRKFICVKVD